MNIMIRDELLFKLKVSFDLMVSRKKVLYESSHQIDTYIDVIVEVLEVYRSVTFELCLDEELIEF